MPLGSLKRRGASLEKRAEALEGLASLLRGGLTMTQALQEWHLNVGEDLRGALQTVGRRVALGAPLETALRAASELLGDDLDPILAATDLHFEVGADPVPMIERAAESVRRRGDSLASGRAAAAGAKLSGWMVGGLPLISLPLLPMAHAPLLDTPGLVVLFFGLVLTAAGMAWMMKLVPKARSSDEPVALFADHVAAAIRAGVSPSSALEVSSHYVRGPLGEQLAAARRRTRLGQPWPEALIAVDHETFSGLAAALRRAERLGSPPGPALETFAAMRRASSARAFELETRRAPVLMVVPLVLCVLPAFGLLAIVPFLRSLAFS